MLKGLPWRIPSTVRIGVNQTFVGHMSARMVRHYTHVSSGAARKPSNCWMLIKSSRLSRRARLNPKRGSTVPDLWGFLWGYSRKALLAFAQVIVSGPRHR